MIKLTCPVCDRPVGRGEADRANISDDICPNCETNLKGVRMLVELPAERQGMRLWLVACIAIICLLLGISLTMAINLSSKHQLPNVSAYIS